MKLRVLLLNYSWNEILIMRSRIKEFIIDRGVHFRKMKKKKLPNNFDLLVASHDMNSFADFFSKYEITATNVGKSTSNAFSYMNLSVEQAQFLLDNGLNPDMDCGFGYSAVAHQADNKDVLELLIKNGADINLAVKSYNGNALARACTTCNVQAVRNLLDAKASVDITCGLDNKTLIDGVLAGCQNIYIPNALEICEMLLQSGAKTSEKTKEYVEEIGKRFEFFRNNINKDILPKLVEALAALYVLFNVTPVEPRIMNSIDEEIKVKRGKWQTQYEELRQKLVPGRGKAETLQGEMIRIVGKITYEILDNGGMNWDTEYKKMTNALNGYLKQNEKMDTALVDEACNIAGHISSCSRKEELYRLTELVVMWITSNSMPKKLGEVDYIR